MVLAGGTAVVLATQPASSRIPSLVVWACGGLAAVGLYGMLAPLLHWRPWHRRTGNAEMNRLIGSQFRALKRRRRWRRLLHRLTSADGHLTLSGKQIVEDEGGP